MDFQCRGANHLHSLFRFFRCGKGTDIGKNNSFRILFPNYRKRICKFTGSHRTVLGANRQSHTYAFCHSGKTSVNIFYPGSATGNRINKYRSRKSYISHAGTYIHGFRIYRCQTVMQKMYIFKAGPAITIACLYRISDMI